MRYAIYERLFGGRPVVVGLEPLPGIALADNLYPAWSYETAVPMLISDADTDFWADVVEVTGAERAVVVRTLHGEAGVQALLRDAVRLHERLRREYAERQRA
ncbi:hypothetical protein [Kyrpidia spormannii]|uniref:Uncharacterized protein n=2 Tax=Kyrpidia spormannii TaxID=2055160 RepID=A0ACA8Z8A2_9BACL|nr:hypothetical protein [Kyrpidia spormannii]CAB3391627.1 conserved protein of unknown function [Kyrpidia spormannii]CAB3392539.1 conserved protein of unknown function [Kyrpidia spormannii]